jgi:hypothetical protein
MSNQTKRIMKTLQGEKAFEVIYIIESMINRSMTRKAPRAVAVMRCGGLASEAGGSRKRTGPAFSRETTSRAISAIPTSARAATARSQKNRLVGNVSVGHMRRS